MQRQVFISCAAHDPDWPLEAIEAVASAIREAGISVSLDPWHQRYAGRFLSQREVDDAIRSSTHIVCLVSLCYRSLWERRPESVVGPGAASAKSIHLIHDLCLGKRRNLGRIITLRRENGGLYGGLDSIPQDLVFDCLAFEWPDGGRALLDHLAGADVLGIPDEIEIEQEKTVSAQVRRVIPPSLGWPSEDEWRAPIGDFPPTWASAWGDDPYGLWADLTVNGATQRMRWIEPSGPEGFWRMSSQAERDAIDDKDVDRWANKGERVLRREFIDQGFWLADTPCTQSFWSAVVGENPSHFSDRPHAAERPVESVSWDAVMDQFIARFAQMPDWGTEDRLYLPTEVEWDYAARAGTRTAYWWGDFWDATRGNADGTSKDKLDDAGTKPVQRSPPNPWGLHDVHGNVWEWCADVWQPHRVPGVPPDEGFRVVRGGSGFYRPGFARIAYRSRWLRSGADQILGFRFALRSPSGPEARGRAPRQNDPRRYPSHP